MGIRDDHAWSSDVTEASLSVETLTYCEELDKIIGISEREMRLEN